MGGGFGVPWKVLTMPDLLFSFCLRLDLRLARWSGVVLAHWPGVVLASWPLPLRQNPLPNTRTTAAWADYTPVAGLASITRRANGPILRHNYSRVMVGY